MSYYLLKYFHILKLHLPCLFLMFNKIFMLLFCHPLFTLKNNAQNYTIQYYPFQKNNQFCDDDIFFLPSEK